LGQESRNWLTVEFAYWVHSYAPVANAATRPADAQMAEKNIPASKVKGKPKAIYIPKDMEKEVEQWAKEHKKIKKILKEIDEMSGQIIKQHVKIKVGRKQKQKAPEPVTADLIKIVMDHYFPDFNRDLGKLPDPRLGEKIIYSKEHLFYLGLSMFLFHRKSQSTGK
jgi:hypothetical protein